MKRLSSVAVVVLLLFVGACGGSGGDSAGKIMPRVESKRLDVAKSDLKKVGLEDGDIKVIGGGLFGVVDDSNWSVCAQDPAAGDPLSGGVSLTVERSCESATSAAPAAEDPTDTADTATTDPPGDAADGDTFTMPNLVGQNLQDAQDKLQSLGSYILRQDDAKRLGRFQVLDSNWKVCSQKQAPGSKVSIATLVVLNAVKLSESCP